MKLLIKTKTVFEVKEMIETIKELIKNSDKNFSRENPAKLLVITKDHIEDAADFVEKLANRMMNPNRIEFHCGKNEEYHFQLNLLAGLPFEAYTKLENSVTITNLINADFIVNVGIAPDHLRPISDNLISLLTNSHRYDIHLDDVVSEVVEDKESKTDKVNSEISIIGDNYDLGAKIIDSMIEKYLPDGAPAPKWNDNLKGENLFHMVVHRGVPLRFMWINTKELKLADVFNGDYVIITNDSKLL